MAEQWLYNFVFFIQTGEGKGGLTARPIEIDHQINSFEIIEMIVEGVTEELFPDGPPDLPEHVLPVVPITWTLVTAKRGSAVPPLKKKPRPKGNGHA